jgi:hypothetical protein
VACAGNIYDFAVALNMQVSDEYIRAQDDYEAVVEWLASMPEYEAATQPLLGVDRRLLDDHLVTLPQAEQDFARQALLAWMHAAEAGAPLVDSPVVSVTSIDDPEAFLAMAGATLQLRGQALTPQEQQVLQNFHAWFNREYGLDEQADQG